MASKALGGHHQSFPLTILISHHILVGSLNCAVRLKWQTLSKKRATHAVHSYGRVEKGKSFSSTWNSENDSGSCCPKLAYNGGALLPLLACVVMGGFKHLVLVRFKEGVVVEDIIRGMEKLATMDCIKSFEWGQDSGSEEMLRQGFTHAITLEFESQEDFLAFSAHPDHLEYAGVFGASIEKIIVFDFTPVSVKARA